MEKITPTNLAFKLDENKPKKWREDRTWRKWKESYGGQLQWKVTLKGNGFHNIGFGFAFAFEFSQDFTLTMDDE